MSIKKYDELRINMKSVQTKQRYLHTIGVAHTCATLAMKYGEDFEKAYLAGLLHDCAKCMSEEDLLLECKKYTIEINSYEKDAPYLLHSKLGAYYAEYKYHITDRDVLNAIRYHTTGRPDMSILEKIVFVADYIEPGRESAPNLSDVRRVSFENMDRAVYLITRDSIAYLKGAGKKIDYASVETLEFYKVFNQN